MKTRKVAGISVVALALAIGCVAVFAQQGQSQEKQGAHQEHNAAMQACAKACSDCQRACDTGATHCAHLLGEGKAEHLATLMSCQDCATICGAASQIVARGGPDSVLICECCAKACDQCGSACEKSSGDKHMQACAEECRKCEKACQGMMKHIPGK